MSEELKVELLNYKKERNKKILIIGLIVLFLSLFFVISYAIYYQKDQVYYVEYNETSNVDYKVYLYENDFFEEPYLGKDQTYVASLIDKIEASMNYKLHVTRPDVEYQYSYSADMQLIVKDGKTSQPIFQKVYVLEEEKNYIHPVGKDLVINKKVEVDYSKYNAIAGMFNETYDLDNTLNSLVINMYVKVTGTCQDLVSDSTDSYVITVNIPLTTKTTSITITSNIPETEAKMLACLDESSNKNVFKWMAYIGLVLDIAAIVVLVVFIIKTRNTHINYERKVNKLVSNYRSYIQKVKNELQFEGCAVIEVTTFIEMLEIRDTIQKPILMQEDEDKTWAKFIIPAETNLVYMFEMKVEDFEKEIAELNAAQEK